MLADDGNTDALSSIPAGWNLSVSNGTTADLGYTSDTLGTVTVTGASVVNGSVTATSFALDDATIGANLTGSGWTGSGWVGNSLSVSDSVVLAGSDAMGGSIDASSVTIAADSELDIAGSLTISANTTTLWNYGTLVVDAGGTLLNAYASIYSGPDTGGTGYGGIDVDAGGTLTSENSWGSAGLSWVGALNNAGTLNNDYAGIGMGADTLNNSGTFNDGGALSIYTALNNTGVWDGGGMTSNYGVITDNAGCNLGGTFYNEGTINENATWTFNEGTLTNFPGCTINIGSASDSEAALYDYDTIINNGTINSFGSTYNYGTFTNNNAFAVQNGGGYSDVDGSGDFGCGYNNGSMTNDGSVTIGNYFENDGALTNDGALLVTGSGRLVNHGQLYSGGSAALDTATYSNFAMLDDGNSYTTSAFTYGTDFVVGNGSSLTLQGSHNAGPGTVLVTDGGTLAGGIISSAITLADGATIAGTFYGYPYGSITITGNVAIQGAGLEGDYDSGIEITPTGSVTIDGSFCIDDVEHIDSGGVLTVNAGGSFGGGGDNWVDNNGTITNHGMFQNDGCIAAGTFTNYGVLVVYGGGSGTVTNETGGLVTGDLEYIVVANNSNAVASLSGSLLVDSLYTVSGDLTIYGNASYANMEITDGSTLTVTGNLSVNSLTVDGGGTLIIDSGSTLTNNGLLANYGTLTNDGALNNGASASIYNYGPMQNYGEINNYCYFENDVTSGNFYAEVNPGDSFNNYGGTVVNNGNLRSQAPRSTATGEPSPTMIPS